ncbi:hypothetical protein DFH09DRAFT_1425777 [Mycena vulgaris]|nr:hypothetical protein DFH09DRAFT_1425777 [Mycena vulgaris]
MPADPQSPPGPGGSWYLCISALEKAVKPYRSHRCSLNSESGEDFRGKASEPGLSLCATKRPSLRIRIARIWRYMYQETIRSMSSAQFRGTLRQLEDDIGLPDGLLQTSVTVLFFEARLEERREQHNKISYVPINISLSLEWWSLSHESTRPPEWSTSTFICRIRSGYLECHFSMIQDLPAPSGTRTSEGEAHCLRHQKAQGGFRAQGWAIHVNKRWRSLSGTQLWPAPGRAAHVRLLRRGYRGSARGALGALPETNGESEAARCSISVNVVHLLLAANGIDYEIAYEEAEEGVLLGLDQTLRLFGKQRIY